MKKGFVLGLILMAGVARAQSDKLELQGRWSAGPAKAMHQRNGYIYIGNGGYLESYQNRGGTFIDVDRIAMPAPVEDIWGTRNNNHIIYAACGKSGLYSVEFDVENGVFLSVQQIWTRSDAFVGGIAVQETNVDTLVYAAAGEAGLVRVDVTDRNNPFQRSRDDFDEFITDVWLMDRTALVTSESAHLFLMNVQNNVVMQDTVTFEPAFPTSMYDLPAPAPNSILVKSADKNATNDSSIVYIPAGYGGLRMVYYITNFQNTGRDTLIETGVWVDSVPLDIIGGTVTNNRAYVTCGTDGLFGPIDVTDPASPGLSTHSFDTPGFAEQILVDNDTAYVTDGRSGLQLYTAEEGSPFSLIKNMPTSDQAYDVKIEGNYAYFCMGATGVNVLSTRISNPPIEDLRPLTTVNTSGMAFGADIEDDRLYVADGSNGLLIFDISSPENLIEFGGYTASGDSCFDVSVENQIAYLACGTRGIRIVDASQLPLTRIGLALTDGYAHAIEVEDNRAYVADGIGGILVYDVSTPSNPILINSYVQDVNAVDIDIENDKIYAANGSRGVLIWDGISADASSNKIGGVATALQVSGNTIFISDETSGLLIYDTSGEDRFEKVGDYPLYGGPARMSIDGETVALAAGREGCFIFTSDIEANLDVTPAVEMDFGVLAPGYSRTQNIWITNTGSSVLKVSQVRVNISEFKYSGDQAFEVFPGDSQRIAIAFEPTRSTSIIDKVRGKVGIYSNVGNHEVNLVGDVDDYDAASPLETDDFTVGLWHFDEQAGNVVNDESGHAFHGSVQGNVTWTGTDTSRHGSSLRFNGSGSSSVMLVNSDDLFNVYNTPFTVEMWFYMLKKLDSGEFYFLMRRGQGSNDSRQMEMAVSGDDGLIASVWAPNADTGDTLQYTLNGVSHNELNAGQWYHTALAWDQDSLYLYLNGILKSSRQLRGQLLDVDDEQLSIGANPGGNHSLYGYIDEARFSRVKREPWEFKVNSSRLITGQDELNFGSVLKNRWRKVPLKLINGGAQYLEIASIEVTGAGDMIDVPFTEMFELAPEADTTLWFQFNATTEVILDGNATVVIESSDPTFPAYYIPVKGQGVVNLPAGNYENDPFTLGLWYFNERGGAGLVAFDSSSFKRDGYLHNNLQHSAEHKKFNTGYSLYFDGENDLCTIPALTHPDSAIRPDWGGLTIEGWFRMENIRPGGQRVLIRRGSSSRYQFDLLVEATTLIGRIYNENNESFEVRSTLHGAIQPQQWYHTALTVNEATDSLSLYLNGDEVDRQPFSGTIAGTSANAGIDTLTTLLGRDWAGNNTFYGYLDEFRISSVPRQAWEFNVNLARITVSSFALNFGSVKVNTERTIKLWAANPGLDTLVVDTLYIAQQTNFSIDTTSFNVAPNDSQLVKVTFSPEDTLSKMSQLILKTNSPFWPYLPITLQGKGTLKATTEPYVVDAFTTGLYHFDELDGYNFEDASDNQNTAVTGGQVELNPDGHFGGAAYLKGTGGYISIPNHLSHQFAYHDFTIDFWFSLAAYPAEEVDLLSRGTGNDMQFKISLEPAGGIKVNALEANGQIHELTVARLSQLNLGQWYHLSFGWDGEFLSLGLNKEIEVDPDPLTAGMRASTEDLIIGNTVIGNRHSFHGSVDEFRISNEIRNAWEYNVLPPVMTIFPDKLDFANVVVGNSRTLRVWINNQGDQDLILAPNTITGMEFSIADADTAITVYQQQVYVLEVNYEPLAENQPANGWLTLNTNDPENLSEIIALSGRGTDIQIPQEPANDAHVVGLYHFNTVSGDSTVDDSDYENAAYFHGGAEWTNDGYFGSGLYLDGFNDYVEIPLDNGLNMDMQSQSYTLECYFKTDTVSQTLFYRQLADTVYGQPFQIKVNQNARIEVAGFETAGELNVANGGWHHFAFTFNHITDSCKLYIDGRIIWTQPWQYGRLTTGSAPLIVGGVVEEGSGVVLEPFAGSIDEIRLSAIARESWEMAFVDFGISLTSNTPRDAFLGNAYSMTFRIPEKLDAYQVFFYYRNGGARIYNQPLECLIVNDSTYQVEVPAEAMTLNGLEYYVKVVNPQLESLTWPALDGESNPHSLPVHGSGLESELDFYYQPLEPDEELNPGELKGQMMTMFSIPCQLDSTHVRDVIEDNLGTFDQYQWRLFYYRQDSSYASYDNITRNYPAFRLEPGRAFWLASHLETSFDVDDFQTVNTDESFAIALNQGWNMIGNPFGFSVDWKDCSVSSPLIQQPAAYLGQEGYDLTCSTLEPWKGYWVYNADADTTTDYLYIRPVEAVSAAAKSGAVPKNNAALDLEEKDWLLHFTAQSGSSKDVDNYAGVRANAWSGIDQYDRHEPPRMQGQVQIAFTASAKTGGAKAFDIRNPDSDGHVWYLQAETDGKKNIRLDWEMVQTLPDDWAAYLFNLDEQTSVNLQTQTRHSINVLENGNYSVYKLAAGTPAFIQAESEGISLVPVEFELFQNFPNPFNPETEIQFTLPKRMDAKIVIYNMLGQQVAVLKEGKMNAGKHLLKWQGRNQAGVQVASGVYLCRLKSKDYMATRKMVLVR